MVNFYYLFDFILLLSILYFTYQSYQNRTYIKIFEYFKIFVAITLSAKCSSFTALALQKLYITKADTYTTLILISFVINLAILYYFGKYLIRFLNNTIKNVNIRKYTAIFVTFLEVVIMITFSLYIIMQLYITKSYLYKSLNHTVSYPKIEKFYNSFLNDEFVNMVLNSDTGTNHKEVIFKSFKNSI